MPPPPAPASERLRAWRPPSLAGIDVEPLSYIVVDEIVGGAVGLAVTPWPGLDEEGRIRFQAGQPSILGTRLADLEPFLARHREPVELRERPLRIGDAFGARVRDAGPEPLVSPERWLVPPVYDVTADAREAAKLAFYGAVVPPLEPEEAARLAQLTDEGPTR